jgi:hypothetical protein
VQSRATLYAYARTGAKTLQLSNTKAQVADKSLLGVSLDSSMGSVY